MGVKAGVLHGDKGVAEVFRHGGNADHDAVFRSLVVGDHIALRIIQEGGLVLIAQKRQIQIGGCFHIALGNAHHRPGQRQSAQNDHQRKQTQGVDADGNQKIGFGKPRTENAELFAAFSR